MHYTVPTEAHVKEVWGGRSKKNYSLKFSTESFGGHVAIAILQLALYWMRTTK